MALIRIMLPSDNKMNDEGTPLSSESQTASKLFQKMELAYVDFFYDEYEPKLPRNGKNEAIYPKISLTIDEDDYELIFNIDLYEQLCKIYIIEGWEGVLAVENKINEEVKVNSDELYTSLNTKPLKLNSWNYQVYFFNFTKKILALLIRETLVNIEKLSAERIITKLSITNIEIAKAWNKYEINTKEVKIKGDSIGRGNDVVIEERIEYSIGKKSLSDDLFKMLTTTVNEKYLYDIYVKKVKFLPSEINRARELSHEPNSFTSDPIFRNQQRINAEDMVKDLPKYSSLKDASEKLLKILTDLFEKQHPLGLLIYSSLKKDFKQSEMENLFGLTIDNLRKDIESIAVKVNPQVSKVEQLLPFKQSNNIIRDIWAFSIPSIGIEKDILEKSLANFANSEFLPIFTEDNLIQLFSHEIIQVDSFEYIVGFHYLSPLIKKLGEIKKEEQKWIDFWKIISKVSSALSFATLVTPASRIFRGGAAIADLALLAYTVSSVTESLKKNNELVQKKLVNQDDFTSENFAQIGEVISLRKEFYDNLTEDVAKEIFNIFVGGNLPIFKEVLLVRNYYNDLETILPEIDENDEKSQ